MLASCEVFTSGQLLFYRLKLICNSKLKLLSSQGDQQLLRRMVFVGQSPLALALYDTLWGCKGSLQWLHTTLGINGFPHSLWVGEMELGW